MIDEETTARLRALDRRFYEDGADDFAEQRQHPWPGWARILADGAPGRVLDVGCGHGRFKAALGGRETSYLGIDQSPRLLERARALHGDHFQRLDVLQDPLPQGPFDLVVAFGLLHHVPDAERRERLLGALLAVGVKVVVTFWRFWGRPRLMDKVRDWSLVGIDPSHLEPHDHLLSFQQHLRYAHHFEDQEVDGLIQRLGVEVSVDFTADGHEGDLNRYVVFKGRGARGPG